MNGVLVLPLLLEKDTSLKKVAQKSPGELQAPYSNKCISVSKVPFIYQTFVYKSLFHGEFSLSRPWIEELPVPWQHNGHQLRGKLLPRENGPYLETLFLPCLMQGGAVNSPLPRNAQGGTSHRASCSHALNKAQVQKSCSNAYKTTKKSCILNHSCQ